MTGHNNMPHRWLLLLAVLFSTAGSADDKSSALPRRLQAHAVPLAEHLKPGENVGRLRPLGMIEIPRQKVNGLSVSQLSGLAWDDDEGLLYAISDKGALFHLRPLFEGDILTGIELRQAVALRELDNQRPLSRAHADSEGLGILNGRNGHKGDSVLLISFERIPRIVRYQPDGTALAPETLPPILANVNSYTSGNKMLESVCHDETLGILTTPEAPLAGERPGQTRLFALDGRSWRFPMPEGSGITALECMGDKRVLVLERDYGRIFGRSRTTLWEVTLDVAPGEVTPLVPNALAALDTLKGHLIDNFEGMTHHQGRRFFVVSDDNDFFLQRTLLLYFEILDE